VEIRVDVHNVSRLGAVHEAGDGDERARDAGATTSDGDLSAFNVELRNASRVRVVDCELLDAEEVVTAWQRRGDGVVVCF
jgi:hypothetical protein